MTARAASPLPSPPRAPIPALLALFKAPLSEKRRTVAAGLASLALMGLTQGSLVAIAGPFLTAIFAEPGSPPMISLKELLAKNFAAMFPALGEISFPRADLRWLIPGALVVAGVLAAFATYAYQISQQKLALHVGKHFRDRLFDAVVRLPYLEFRRRSPGEWMSVIMNDVMFLQMRFTDFLTGIVRDSVTVVAGIGAMLFIHWPTGLVLLAFAPLIAFGMGRTGRRIARFAEAYQRELGRLSAAILDFRARFDFIRAQHGEERERERFTKLNDAYFRMVRSSIFTRSIFAPMLELLGFAFFAVILAGISSGRWGAGLTPVMMQFFAALGLLLKPLKELGEQVSRLEETRGAFAHSTELLQRLERDAAQIRNEPARALPAGKFAGLTLKSVTAGMDGVARFRGENLAFAPGRSIAVIGPSGAGKSTLLKTLAGLLPPQSWDASLPWKEAVNLTSMVSQEPFLFDAPLAENLNYGLKATEKPAASEVAAALALVNLSGEVAALPNGLQTPVRAIGSNVSGGQLQRLCIARGLLRGRPVWLLDEATAAIDPKSEREITERLIAACRARGTVLMAVTHRLLWLPLYDEVWFIEDGYLKLKGSHAQLMAEDRYRRYIAAAEADGHER